MLDVKELLQEELSQVNTKCVICSTVCDISRCMHPMAVVNMLFIYTLHTILYLPICAQNMRKKTSHLVKDKVDMMNKNGIVKEAEPPLPQGNYYLFKDPGRESPSSDKEPVTLDFLPREKALTLFSRLDPSVVVGIQDTLIKVSFISCTHTLWIKPSES